VEVGRSWRGGRDDNLPRPYAALHHCKLVILSGHKSSINHICTIVSTLCIVLLKETNMQNKFILYIILHDKFIFMMLVTGK